VFKRKIFFVKAYVSQRPLHTNFEGRELLNDFYVLFQEQGQLSRYSVELQTGLPGFDPWQGQDWGAYPALYKMGTVNSFPGGKAGVPPRPHTSLWRSS
jgi:hypothetical protein